MTGLVTPECEPGAAGHRSVGQGEAAAEEMVAAAVVVELCGELDGAARVEVDALLETLIELPQPVWVDVSAAWSSTGAALRRLCRFRAARQAAGRRCRLRGLHAGMTAELAEADLAEVFAVWADTVWADTHLTTTPR